MVGLAGQYSGLLGMLDGWKRVVPSSSCFSWLWQSGSDGAEGDSGIHVGAVRSVSTELTDSLSESSSIVTVICLPLMLVKVDFLVVLFLQSFCHFLRASPEVVLIS